MKVALISAYEQLTAFGIRSLSAVLKRAGFETQMLFLPRESEGIRSKGFLHTYPQTVLDQVAEITADSDLIGITLMSNYFENAVQLTQHLRRFTSAPIIWGGIHPTVRPAECLEYADLVCVGEGEEALLELVQHLEDEKGCAGIANIWYKRDGEVARTPLRTLPQDLDSYPHPDYDLDNSFVLHYGRVQPLTEELFLHYSTWPYSSDSVPSYSTMMSRGCSYQCTYCCNNAQRRIYEKWHIRRRTVPNFIRELEDITSRFPGIRRVTIDDDAFINDVATLREFAAAYKQRIRLPIFVTGFQPAMVDEERIGILVDAGMDRMRMGIQTGSMRVMHEVYRRPGSREQIVRATKVLSKFAGRLEPPLYDLIVDNPWETEEDQLETLAMLLDIPRPYQLLLFSLTFFPGTHLYDRARQEGLLQDERRQTYRKNYADLSPTYMNGLVKMVKSQRAPRWLLLFLASQRIRRLNCVWLLNSFNRLFRVRELTSAGCYALWRRDWSAFASAWRARIGRRSERYGTEANAT